MYSFKIKLKTNVLIPSKQEPKINNIINDYNYLTFLILQKKTSVSFSFCWIIGYPIQKAT